MMMAGMLAVAVMAGVGAGRGHAAAARPAPAAGGYSARLTRASHTPHVVVHPGKAGKGKGAGTPGFKLTLTLTPGLAAPLPAGWGALPRMGAALWTLAAGGR